MHRIAVKEHAARLRLSGFGLAAIAKRLRISKSTASVWLRDLPLDQKVLADRKALGNPDIGNLSRKRAFDSTNRWINEATIQWNTLRHEGLFMLGVGLYWGEGGKTQRTFTVSNSDPRLIKAICTWCKVYFRNTQLRGKVSAHSDVDLNRAKRYWSRITGIDKTTITVALVAPKSSKQKRPRNLLPYGTFCISARKGSNELHTKVMHWINLASKEESASVAQQ